MKITLAMLKAKGACADQVILFRATFGEGGEVTLEKCLSVAHNFDWVWAARYLFSYPVWVAFLRMRGPALDRFASKLAPETRQKAESDYQKDVALAFFCATQIEDNRT